MSLLQNTSQGFSMVFSFFFSFFFSFSNFTCQNSTAQSSFSFFMREKGERNFYSTDVKLQLASYFYLNRLFQLCREVLR